MNVPTYKIMKNLNIIEPYRKIFISAFLGIACLLFSPFGIHTHIGEISVNVPFFLFLPALAAFAYGWKYGLVAGLSGGAMFPFLLWPDDGWANVGSAIIFIGFYSCIGLFQDRRYFFRLHYPGRFLIPCFAAMSCLSLFDGFLFNTLLKLNPPFWSIHTINLMPQKVLWGFALKDSINILFITLAAETLLRLPMIRKLMRIPVVFEMEGNLKIFSTVILAFVGVWLINTGLEFFLSNTGNAILNPHLTIDFYILMSSGFLVSRILFHYNEYRIGIQSNLNNSEIKFRALFENAYDAIFIMQDDTFIECNPATLKIFGCQMKDILGKTISSFSPQYQPDGTLSENKALELIHASQQGNSKLFEWRHQRLDGTTFDAEVSLSRIVINKQILLYGISRDISLQKEAGELLLLSEKRYQKAEEVGQIGSWEYDLITDQFWGSEEAKRIYGFDLHAERFTRDEVMKCVSNREKADLALNDLIVHNKPYNIEFEITPFNSTEKKFIHSVAEIVRDDEGKPLKIVGIIHNITERKKAEGTILLLAHAIRSISECISITDMEDKIIFVNNAFLNTYQYEEHELIGKKITMVRSLNNPVYMTSKILPSTLKGGWQGELQNKRKDGVEFPVSLSTSIIYDDFGEEIAIIGVATDITEQKLAEDEILKLLKAVEQNPATIIITDLNGTIEYVNPKFSEITGFTPSEAIGNNPRIFKSGKTNAKEYAKLWMTISSGRTWKGEFCNVKKNGEIFWESASISPIINDSGIITHYIAIKEDITDIKKAEKALRDSENYFRSVVLNAPVISFVLDKEGIFKLSEGRGLLKLGLQPGEVVGLSAFDVYRDFPIIIEGITNSLAGKYQLLETEIQDSIFDVVYNPVFDRNGNVSEVIGVAIDITEQKKTELDLIKLKEKAEESDRLKSAFLANMSHEIRTPMNSILGFASLLKEAAPGGREQETYIDIIETSSARLLNLINDLIVISKVESGQIEITFSEINLQELFGFLCRLFKVEANQKGVDFSADHSLNDENVEIITDREKLFTILNNLIKNSLKYTQSGTIRFGCNFKNNMYEFFVHDTGIGIPPDKLEIVFERFVQADISLSRRFDGAGLGLSISKAFVEKLGGEIWLESEIGVGTCFYFTLPVKAAEAIKPASQSEQKIFSDEESLSATILITEDDETSVFYLKKILKNKKWNLIFARTGEEAIELCRIQKNIRLVLMDILLPNMNGDLAAKQIKSFRPDIRIIAQTAYAFEEDKTKYSDAFDSYLTKPINSKELKSEIQKMLTK